MLTYTTDMENVHDRCLSIALQHLSIAQDLLSNAEAMLVIIFLLRMGV